MNERGFVSADEALRVAEARREAALQTPSPYRISEGNPFAGDCPLPDCPWDGKSDRELSDHLGAAHGDLSIRRHADVLARRQGRVLRLADMRIRRTRAGSAPGRHQEQA